MKATLENKTVKDLVDLRKAKLLIANPEYQRGVVWSDIQRKKLIDSIMRGYPLPIIYLHHIKREVAGIKQEGFEIIDGQQRITSISDYVEGGFALFDPIKDMDKARFPAFLRDQPCPWASKYFDELDEALRNELLNTPLQVALIETNEDNEVRDLFIRLQAGSALNAQETRDALPGAFTEFILKLGGKPEIAKYPGHEFFPKVMKSKPRTDRGKTRQLASQMCLTLLRFRDFPDQNLPDINSQALTEFYHNRLDFDLNGVDAIFIKEIFDELLDLLGDGKRKPLRAHEAIHASILIAFLKKYYVSNWRDTFAQAFDEFVSRLDDAKKSSEASEYYHYWTQYGQWTRVSSDKGEYITRRNTFYLEEMRRLLGELTLKDSKRVFDPLERNILYNKQSKKCAVCNGVVKWEDIEIHHVTPHSEGGTTSVINAAMVHKDCHPRSAEDVANFARSFTARNAPLKF